MPPTIGPDLAKQKLAAFECVAKAAVSSGKSTAVGGAREHLECQISLLQLGVRCLTGGSDAGQMLSAARRDGRQLREVRLRAPLRGGSRGPTPWRSILASVGTAGYRSVATRREGATAVFEHVRAFLSCG